MSAEFLFLMHDDAAAPIDDAAWPAYFARLNAASAFLGGSSIGDGTCVRADGAVVPISARLTGYIKVAAADLDAAQALLAGNPVYDAGGTIEIRELPRD